MTPTMIMALCLLAAVSTQEPVRHWAFTAPRPGPLPEVGDASWVRSPIDNFVLARLEREGLAPRPEAARETLLRRVTLDLTGLAPTLAELDAFVADRGPGAYERAVDRLLASPRYAEHMARQWLDLARYADSNGYEKDRPREIWAWRDWVIEAFDADLPFDRFTVEQLAGDLLPDATIAQRVATGFQRNSMLNDEGGIDAEEFRVVAVKDRVHTAATVWLGLTMDCAQCHDHKFDPISIREYYAFYAFFDQTEDTGVGNGPLLGVPTPEQRTSVERLSAQLARWRSEYSAGGPEFDAELASWARDLAADLALRAARQPELGTWHAIGPFVTGDAKSAFARSFPPERGVDLERRHYGRAWTEHTEWTDGEVHGLSGEGAANYLFRTITAPVEQRAVLSLGSDDGIRVWLNGEELLHKEVQRAAAPDQELVRVLLRAGDNRLLVKIVNGGGPTGFAFRLRDGDEPDDIRAVLGMSEEERTDEQRARLAAYYRSVAPHLAELRGRIAAVEETLARIDMPQTMVMVERIEPRATRVLERGDFRRGGDRVEPDVPAFLPPLPERAPRNRLGLARWLVDPQNPLTARVAVNRMWASCFGRGLLRTSEDFGTQGEPPTHPGLLDWLALEFVRDGFSVKRAMRRIVTSATYRQDSAAPPALRARDPDNLLLARGPRYRLDFEEIRDVSLMAAGLLSERVGGPSVMPPQPAGTWENSFGFHDLDDRWVEAEGEDRYRRGMYVFVRRTATYPSLKIFDGSSREVCTVQRSRTDTPLQALTTLNDPAFVEAAGGLAVRVVDEGGPAAEQRAARLFRVCTGRRPAPAEARQLVRLYRVARARYAADPQAAAAVLRSARVEVGARDPVELAAWLVVANVGLNLDETLTKG